MLAGGGVRRTAAPQSVSAVQVVVVELNKSSSVGSLHDATRIYPAVLSVGGRAARRPQLSIDISCPQQLAAAVAAVDRRDRSTDRRTDTRRYIDPAPHIEPLVNLHCAEQTNSQDRLISVNV